jgi:hypothetical protein
VSVQPYRIGDRLTVDAQIGDWRVEPQLITGLPGLFEVTVIEDDRFVDRDQLETDSNPPGKLLAIRY